MRTTRDMLVADSFGDCSTPELAALTLESIRVAKQARANARRRATIRANRGGE